MAARRKEPGAEHFVPGRRTLPALVEAAAGFSVHPASILRAEDDAARKAAFEAFVADWRVVAQALAADGEG